MVCVQVLVFVIVDTRLLKCFVKLYKKKKMMIVLNTIFHLCVCVCVYNQDEVVVKVDSTKEVLKMWRWALAAASERYTAARAGMIGVSVVSRSRCGGRWGVLALKRL